LSAVLQSLLVLLSPSNQTTSSAQKASVILEYHSLQFYQLMLISTSDVDGIIWEDSPVASIFVDDCKAIITCKRVMQEVLVTTSMHGHKY